VRNQLAAAQYFEENNIRQHFTTLTQMLMIHQPADPLRFMQEWRIAAGGARTAGGRRRAGSWLSAVCFS
jgi:hypothetical protein